MVGCRDHNSFCPWGPCRWTHHPPERGRTDAPWSKDLHKPSYIPAPLPDFAGTLTYAYILVIQLCRAVAVEAQAAVLAVLAPRVVLAADAGHHVEEVDVAAAVGVAVALAVCGEEERAGELGQEHPPLRWADERSHLLWRRLLLR